MKKTYRLTKGKHAPARVIDAIKANINQHIKRERTKDLPEGFDFWDFECKVGPSVETATSVHVSAAGKAVDDAALASTTESIYVEIETTGKRRKPSKPNPKAADEVAKATESIKSTETKSPRLDLQAENPPPKSQPDVS